MSSLAERRPDGECPHLVRGVRYASGGYVDELKSHRFETPSGSPNLACQIVGVQSSLYLHCAYYSGKTRFGAGRATEGSRQTTSNIVFNTLVVSK